MVGPEFFVTDEDKKMPMKDRPQKLPPILNRDAKESETKHRQRVRSFLLAFPDCKFTEIAPLIDPNNAAHHGFQELYEECCESRAKRYSENSNLNGESRCKVF